MKRLTLAAQLIIYTVVFLAILVFVNLIAQQYHFRFDLTKGKLQSLSKQSIQVIKHLKKEVNIIAFYPLGPERSQAKDLLSLYHYANKHITYTFIDPERHPLEARRYNVTNYPTLIVKCGKRTERLYQLSEERLTNAIIRVTRGQSPVLYFVVGHGEHDLDSKAPNGYQQFKTALNNRGFTIKPLWLVKEDKIPEDAALVVIGGPKKAFLAVEIQRLKTYLQKGGHLLFLIDPQTAPNIAKFLKQIGVLLDNDIIVDKISRLFGGDYLIPVIVRYNPKHPITRGFKLACFLPLARSVRLASKLPDKEQGQVLAWTSEKAWGETNIKLIETQNKAAFDKSDIPGPVPVAVAVWKDKGFKTVVVGDSDFVSNAYISLSGNQDLALNMISWLTEQKDLITIPAKGLKNKPLVLSRTQNWVIFWLPVVILPLTIVVIGIVVFIKRRQRS